MRRVPIRLRVAAAFAVAMAVVLAAVGSLLYVRVSQHLEDSLERQLRVRGQDLAALVATSRAPISAVSHSGLIERGESYVQLLDGRGRVLGATAPLGSSPLLTPGELARARRGTIFTTRSAVPGLDEPSRILATPVDRRGEQLVLLVGITSEENAETLRSLSIGLLIAGPIALALATIVGYALAGLSLRPVESMRARAAAISAERPGERLPVPETSDEIQRLGETLNEMLERLEAALMRERAFVADAGHELRTPLALLRMELELALRQARSPEELRAAVQRSSEEVDRLTQLAEDLLLIARSDTGELPLRWEELDAADVVASVARRFDWRAREAGRPVAADAVDAAVVRGDRLRLEQALGNLVDNALRHGAGTISLWSRTNGDRVELHVTDEGTGFPPEFVERAFERFARPDHGRTGGGTGLGLSIVRVIAHAHGGTVHLVNREAGGADVWLDLPADGAEPTRTAAP